MSLPDTLETQLRLQDDTSTASPGHEGGVTYQVASGPTSDPSSSQGASTASKPPRARPPRVDTPAVQLSKALSYLLRHGASKEGLKMRSDGYVLVSDILSRPKISKLDLDGEGRRPGLEDVKRATEDNEKKRFEMRLEGEGEGEGEWWIRATQGHSLKEVTDVDMTPVTLDNYVELLSLPSTSSSTPTVLHGTTTEAWEKILSAGGLSRMGRNHIHLAKGRPGQDGVISGMRASSSVLLHIDVEQALRDGVPFLVASNGAVLTPGIKMDRPRSGAGANDHSTPPVANEGKQESPGSATAQGEVRTQARVIQPPEDPEEKKRRREAAKKEKKERKLGGGGAKSQSAMPNQQQLPAKPKPKKKGPDIDWDGMLPLRYVTLAEGRKGELLWKRQ